MVGVKSFRKTVFVAKPFMKFYCIHSRMGVEFRRVVLWESICWLTVNIVFSKPDLVIGGNQLELELVAKKKGGVSPMGPPEGLEDSPQLLSTDSFAASVGRTPTECGT